MRVEMPKTLDAVVIERENLWVGVFLEPYLVAQAKSEGALIDEMRRVLTAHIVISLESGVHPFKNARKAPARYWPQDDAEPAGMTLLYRFPSQAEAEAEQASLVVHRLNQVA